MCFISKTHLFEGNDVYLVQFQCNYTSLCNGDCITPEDIFQIILDLNTWGINHLLLDSRKSDPGWQVNLHCVFLSLQWVCFPVWHLQGLPTSEQRDRWVEISHWQGHEVRWISRHGHYDDMALGVAGKAGLIKLAVSNHKSWRQPHLFSAPAPEVEGKTREWDNTKLEQGRLSIFTITFLLSQSLSSALSMTSNLTFPGTYCLILNHDLQRELIKLGCGLGRGV